MNAFSKTILIGLTLSVSKVFAQLAIDPTYADDPIQFFQTTETEVKTDHPNAKLLFISTFISGKPDPECSQLGWQYVYQDDKQAVGIRKSIRHLINSEGKCGYVPDSSLTVDKDDYPLLGYQAIEGRLSLVKIKMNDGLTKAKMNAGNNFAPNWLGLKTPLHPKAGGKLYWSFRGPVSCNKTAEIFIDAESGTVNASLSFVPTCP